MLVGDIPDELTELLGAVRRCRLAQQYVELILREAVGPPDGVGTRLSRDLRRHLDGLLGVAMHVDTHDGPDDFRRPGDDLRHEEQVITGAWTLVARKFDEPKGVTERWRLLEGLRHVLDAFPDAVADHQ